MEKQEMVVAHYEISITSHHAGFGMFQLGEHNYSPQCSWAELSDLEEAMRDGGSDDLLPLAEALQDAEFIALGIEDIRGKIYGGDPLYLYAARKDGEIQYCGVERVEAPINYWE